MKPPANYVELGVVVEKSLVYFFVLGTLYQESMGHLVVTVNGLQ